MRKMRSFRVMATLIRIEGSRLNQAGVDFETLAEDVRKLASDIEENGKTILAGSLELRDIVRQAGVGTRRIRNTAAGGTAAHSQRRRGPAWRRCGNGERQASEVTRDMASRYDSVRREIGELVMSLQVHDITRQQVEHAAAALGQWDRGDIRRSAALLVRVCGLQRAQLDHSKEAFLAAVRAVRESLAGISRNVSGNGAKARGAGQRRGDDGLFLAEMEQGFAGIRAALAEYAESRYALSIVAETVADGVRKMSEFVATIEEIGFRMQRIALNANIKAIQHRGARQRAGSRGRCDPAAGGRIHRPDGGGGAGHPRGGRGLRNGCRRN